MLCCGAGVLGYALGQLANAANQARYNKEMAKVMEEKAQEVGRAIQGLGEALNAAAKDAQKKKDCKAVLDPLISVIHQCKVACENFCKEGYMKAMWNAKSNSHRIDKLLKAVNDRMNAVSMTVQNVQLNLTVTMDQKLDRLLDALAARSGGVADPAEMDPQVLADIAKQAGMEASEDIKQELCGMSERMLEK